MTTMAFLSSSHASCSATSASKDTYNHYNPFTSIGLTSGKRAFTEAAFVSCHSDAFSSSVRRLSDDWNLEHWETPDTCFLAMELYAGEPSLERSGSHHSNASGRSSRSQTVRVKPRKYASYMSSSASSISDKSLTSFPSFSPESPRDNRPLLPVITDGAVNTVRKASDPPPSIVESLTSSSNVERTALFDDAPLTTRHIPGALHLANDEHIERLIARNGAVTLVRQISEDLAQRDTQIAATRRKAENRERALRKIILECGLSNLDLETRLRAIEAERRVASDASTNRSSAPEEGGLEDLMSDAMSQDVILAERAIVDGDVTIRAKDSLKALEDRPVNVQKGWKDYIWGGTSKKSSRSSSPGGHTVNGTLSPSTMKNGTTNGRRTVLQNGLFEAPEEFRSPSRASSMNIAGAPRERKPSSGLATLALKLVAGGAITSRNQDDPKNRGRANSTGTSQPNRGQSSASARTTMSARAPAQQPTKAIPTGRRSTAASSQAAAVRVTQDRWDTMGASPQNISSPSVENSGPVEMDQILPPDAQPPTLTQIHRNPYNQEFLTDRFGFIYDQRRKKRQKEAAEKVRKSKRGSRVEMLNSARSGISAGIADDDIDNQDERPDTPTSLDERGEDGKPTKRWQDYLKIATFPTELLSHTPLRSEPVFEVMEGGEVPKSPGVVAGERGFAPSASVAATAVSVTSNNATISKPATPSSVETPLAAEDMEPVKLLLQQLDEVHDSLQKEKTVRWNDFMRKVRAERKRDGEAAAAALASTDKTSRASALPSMPEASLMDGEIIGIAGLGNKGKVGRAKWNEFRSLVLGGIPVAFRAKTWAECSGAAAMRIPGYYDDLVARREGGDDPAIVAQIQMDINRTLTDNIFFRKGQGVAKLNEVLLAYSRRNPEVGYCQGMNLITACLLLIMPTAEDAFWVLTSIIENTLPQGYYDHSLLASRADQQVLRQYVSEILPKLSAHLDDLAIELEALTFQWFLSVFTDCLSAEALFRVWDVVLCINDGSTFLFQVALALLKLNEPQLLQCSTPAGVYTYINHQMTNHAISIDGLIHASEGLRKVVKRDEVETRRDKAIEAEKDMTRQREAKNAERKAARLAKLEGCVQDGSVMGSSGSVSPSETRIKSTQLVLGDDGFGELTVRTPVPIDEERDLQLG